MTHREKLGLVRHTVEYRGVSQVNIFVYIRKHVGYVDILHTQQNTGYIYVYIYIFVFV